MVKPILLKERRSFYEDDVRLSVPLSPTYRDPPVYPLPLRLARLQLWFYHKFPRQSQRYTISVVTFVFVFGFFYWYFMGYPITLPKLHHRLIDRPAPEFSFSEREPGSFAPLSNGIAPRDPPLKRKAGLLAIPVGEKSKVNMVPVLQLFYKSGFDIMLFHYDQSDWRDIPNYSKWHAVRVLHQTKYWYAKRFLSPSVVENYDYLFLWDDDVGLPDDWLPLNFIKLLKDYHIHVAQPALLSGLRENFQREVVRFHNSTVNLGDSIGRFSNFVEVMFPVFSKAVWPCTWRLLPFDGISYWGTDNAWYPVCAAYGFCRFAIIDVMPVHHLDKRLLGQDVSANLIEMDHYRAMVVTSCKDKSLDTSSNPDTSLTTAADKESSWPHLSIVQSKSPVGISPLQPKNGDTSNANFNENPPVIPWQATSQVKQVCEYFDKKPFGDSFYSIRNITVRDMNRNTCPEYYFWQDVQNSAWWGPDGKAPPTRTGWWIGRESELAHVRKIKQKELDERKKSGGINKGSW
jgi:hypothetical protein